MSLLTHIKILPMRHAEDDYMFFYDKPFQKQLGVMAFLEAHE